MLSQKINDQLLGGKLTDHKSCLAGYVRGYYLTFTMDNTGYHICVNASKESDSGNVALTAFLDQTRMGNKKISNVTVQPTRFTVNIRQASFAKKIPELVNGIMEPIFNHLTLNSYVSGCGCCGSNAQTISPWQVNNEVVYLCDGCAQELEQSLKDNQSEVKSQKSNVVAGLVGAFLGALIGCVLWVIIGKLGYISGIAGLVMGVCTLKGYALLGKHLDKKGVIFSILMMAILIYFANKFTWTLSAYSELKDYDWTFTEVFQNLGYILSESELVGSYFLDLLVGYGLTALASFTSIRNAFAASNGSYKIKKLK